MLEIQGVLVSRYRSCLSLNGFGRRLPVLDPLAAPTTRTSSPLAEAGLERRVYRTPLCISHQAAVCCAVMSEGRKIKLTSYASCAG
jgi:hypothetical protein